MFTPTFVCRWRQIEFAHTVSAVVARVSDASGGRVTTGLPSRAGGGCVWLPVPYLLGADIDITSVPNSTTLFLT